ncbi:MAG: membrane protein insertion efficiency factor YidD [Candidatus Eisenbacteria bacterium]|nr:membrane protein insertion efficiency factor YidD [Candidatus Eisenbacteria bacterium]
MRDVGGLPIFLYMRNHTQDSDTAGLSSVGIVAFRAIRLYQCLISPHLGRRCRFRPTCSEFACHVLTEKGLLAGIVLTADRLARDHGFIREDDYPHNEEGIYLDPAEPPCTPRHLVVSRLSGAVPMPDAGDRRGRTGE